jgi:ribose 5-phosphate isomerase A
MKSIEIYKKKAAEKACEFIQDGMIIGMGSGSTTMYALERIGELIRGGHLKKVIGIPSSLNTAKLAGKFGIPLTDFKNHAQIDLTLDGADEVDHNLNMIKGGGGAHLREKIVFQASKRNIVVVDKSKLSQKLGSKRPVPIEILPFAVEVESQFLESIGAKINLRKIEDGNPYLTDQQNLIIDASFGIIEKPDELDSLLNSRAGIMAHGLFIGMASEVIVAGEEGIQIFSSTS